MSADRYIRVAGDGKKEARTGVVIGNGAADSGRLVALNPQGEIDPSLISALSVDGLEQLVNDAVAAAIANLGVAGLTWTVITGPVAVAANTAYAVNGLSLISLNLPVGMPDNTRLAFYAYSSAGFRLQQTSPSDLVQVGDSFTTVGISGHISSMGQGAGIELVKLPARWIGKILHGHFDVV